MVVTVDVVDVDAAVAGAAEAPGDGDVASKSGQKDWESNSETRSMSPNRRPKRDGTCLQHTRARSRGTLYNTPGVDAQQDHYRISYGMHDKDGMRGVGAHLVWCIAEVQPCAN